MAERDRPVPGAPRAVLGSGSRHRPADHPGARAGGPQLPVVRRSRAARPAARGPPLPRGASAVVLAPPAREVTRTANAAALIDRWFSTEERSRGRLPQVLGEIAARAGSQGPNGELGTAWTRAGDGADLVVRAFRVP